MIWESKFPHPGDAPEKPTGDPFGVTPATHKYNDWVRAMRKHNVAKAVDTLIRREAMGPGLEAVETITLTLGLMLLDGSIKEIDPSNIFGAFFP